MLDKTAIAIAILNLAGLVASPASIRQARPQDDQKPSATAPKVIRKPLGALEKEATERAEPVYPPLARAAKVTGTVVVEVTVDETGNVTAARAVSGHPLLKDAAVEAARKWKFKPAMLDGASAQVTGPIVFKFAIDGAQETDRDQPPRHRTISELEQEVREDPGSMQAHATLGMEYAVGGRYDDPVAQLKEAIRILPRSAGAHHRLGLVYFRMDRFKDAADEFKTSTECDPDYPEAGQVWFSLGTSTLRLGDYEDAIDAFKRALGIPPVVPETYVGLGMAYTMVGKYQEAVGPLKHSVELSGDNPVAHAYLGKAYLEVGDKQSAMKEYEVLKRLDGDSAGALLGQIKAKWPAR
jgi:TonB family protein